MRSERLLLLAVWSLLAVPAQGELVEHVLAAVDEMPLLQSELQALARVRGLAEEQALEALIDERLMFREAARLPEATLGAEEELAALRELEQRVGAALASELGEGALRRLARRQATILKYVRFRFRPQLRVEDAELRRAYEQEYRETVPFEAVARELEERLRARALDLKIEAWVKELRSGATIRYNRGARP